MLRGVQACNRCSNRCCGLPVRNNASNVWPTDTLAAGQAAKSDLAPGAVFYTVGLKYQPSDQGVMPSVQPGRCQI